MALASNFYIGGNDEHGMNPPTAGKRTPIMPYINRSFYENEFNRPAKIKFLQACLRTGYNVFDVKPEIQDTSVSTRVVRVNAQRLSLLVNFAYNAFGSGATFNSAHGINVFYSIRNTNADRSRTLSEDVFENVSQNGYITGRDVSPLDIGLLSNVNCPATLIEAGFMTNFNEAKLMIDPDYQLSIAEYACRGVCEFLDVPYITRSAMTAYPTLRQGNSGNKVRLLQYLLNEYSANISVDGSFGAGTGRAVRAFQQNNGLSVDGIVGRDTWTALLDLTPAAKTIRQGARSSNVLYLQQKLLSKLYNITILDGIFGAETRNAVVQFQTDNGLTPDGIVGPATWAIVSRVGGGRPQLY